MIIDYKTLLFKYMEHVGVVEGSTFLDELNVFEWAPQFTEEEIAALKEE